jgi:hypothetical protein
MQKIISFKSDILKGLAVNSDMLSSYVLAAIADQGQGVKVCWSLWPHLTPPAKVGGVARALVKMGLLVAMPGGLYQVVTTKGATEERNQGESGATSQQQTSEVPAKATEGIQAADSDESEARAGQEQQTSDEDATSQHSASDGEAGGDIEALEALLDAHTTSTILYDEPSIIHETPDTGNQGATQDLEGRALALARRSWEIMPDPVKARVNHDFDAYWQQSKSQHMRTASNA